MNLLLDTHILIWALLNDPKLSTQHKEALSADTTELYVSAASVWEASIKRAAGKLPVPETMFQVARQKGCLPLPITWEHADVAGKLPGHHSDPFDRMLIAQAKSEGLVIVTADRMFRHYDVDLL